LTGTVGSAAALAEEIPCTPLVALAAPAPHQGLWSKLIEQSRALSLPTAFLESIPSDFVMFVFEDLHAYAAEYHPDEHRMILNRSLSFNSAAGTLKPLKQLAPPDVATLFHELMHAYMDYLATVPNVPTVGGGAAKVWDTAKALQHCRYQVVAITPVRQRKEHTEIRVLTERESWEALNETWAVFVGWVVWTRLESKSLQLKGDMRPPLKRWAKADRDAEWLGYYEPEDPDERLLARKRFLSPMNRLTPQETALLLENIFREEPRVVRQVVSSMASDRPATLGNPPCPPS
jgi:hypothetical protein